MSSITQQDKSPVVARLPGLINLSLLCASMMTVWAGEWEKEMFKSVFQYELNNRVFAHACVSRLAAKITGGEQAGFWKAYAKLEQLSQPLYRQMANKHALQVNWFMVNLKARLTYLAFYFFPQMMLSIMTDATEKYVDKLKPLLEHAKKEDRAFFEYVLAQEQAQAIALRHAVENHFDRAVAVINDFVRENQSIQLGIAGGPETK